MYENRRIAQMEIEVSSELVPFYFSCEFLSKKFALQIHHCYCKLINLQYCNNSDNFI